MITIKEHAEQTKRKMKPLLDKMNMVDNPLLEPGYSLIVGGGRFTVKQNVYPYASFTSKNGGEEHKQLTVYVEYFRKTNGRLGGEKLVKIGRERSIPEFDDVLFAMKEYWEEYAKIKKLDGMVMVYGESLSTEWRDMFQEKIPLPSGEEKYDARITNRLLFKSYSQEYKDYVDNFENAKKVLANVFDQEKLLSGYFDQLTYLFYHKMRVEYAGTVIELDLGKKKKFGKIIVRNCETNEEKCMDMIEEEIVDYLQTVKANQRLANLLEVPKSNYLSVLSHMGITTSFKEREEVERITVLLDKQFEKLEEGNTWESIEIEMGVLLKEILSKETFKPNQYIVNQINNVEMVQFKLQTENYFYDFIFEWQRTNGTIAREEITDFQLFRSTEETDETARNYFIGKITETM